MKPVAAAVVFCLSLFASSAFAQRAYIDHRTYPADFAALEPGDPDPLRPGYVFRHDGRGWYWEQQGTPLPGMPPPPPSPPPTGTDPCDEYISPYVQGGNPELLARCVDERFRKLPKPSLTVYEVGKSYAHAYPDQRMVVLSVALTVEGAQAVLAQWLTTDNAHQAGDVFGFRSDDGRQTWTPMR